MAESKIAVYGAIASNVAIATVKFIVAGITGSSAMLSEGIHSTVDTGNGLLLLVGIRLSQRKATANHPFGHGKELFFWSLIVAVLIFGAGGGVSAYEGILHIMQPKRIEDAFWSYLTLGAAALFEGASFVIALRQFMKANADTPFLQALRESRDPTTYMVMAEDSAALAGLVTAAVGIFLSDRFDMPRADGAASIVIGLILAGMATLLIYAIRELLVGQGIQPRTAARIRELALATPGVRTVGPPASMYIGPDEVLLAIDVGFDPATSATEVAAAVRRLESSIREQYPRIKRIYIEARSPSESAQAAS
jgi:cation diffusion facilitator family transporter